MQNKNSALPLGLLIVLALIWGSSFILMKKGLMVFSPQELGAYRLTIAGIFLSPIVISGFKNMPKKIYPYFAVVGIIGNGLPAFMFATAQTKLNSATAGALNALTPLFTLLVAALIFKIRVMKTQMYGVVIGLIGALGLIGIKSDGGYQTEWAYGMLVVVACVFYAISVNTVKVKLQGISPMRIAAFPLAIVGIPALIYLLIGTSFIEKIQHHPQALSALGYVTVLGVIGSAASLVLFNKLIQLTNAVFASSVTYLMPIVALAWGFADGEALGWIHALGLLSILAGIYLVNKK